MSCAVGRRSTWYKECRLTWNRACRCNLAQDSARHPDRLSFPAPPAHKARTSVESMVDHVECVFHWLGGEADDPLKRAAQVQGHLDCPCSCKRAKEQHHSDGRVTGCE